MSRDFKVAIRGIQEYFEEAGKVLADAEQGIDPAQPVERVYFHDLKTFLRYMTPKRFELIERLHNSEALSIRALAKMLGRHYKNVFEDVKMLEQVGLLERTGDGLYIVPWDEINTTIKLAA